MALGPTALGAASALSWGSGDFVGGLAGRRVSAFAVVFVSHATTLVVLAVAVALIGEPLPALRPLAFAAAAGLVGAVGLGALYAALAAGRMTVAAPLAGVLTAALPAIAGAMLEGLPGPATLAGFGLAGAGILLVTTSPGATRKGLGAAVIAGVGLGGFLVLFDAAEGGGLAWSLLAARLASAALLFAIVITRRLELPRGKALALTLGAAVLDLGGNAFFALAAWSGRLDVAGVVSSLYPAATVVLAALVLRERLDVRQRWGVLAALVALPLMAW